MNMVPYRSTDMLLFILNSLKRASLKLLSPEATLSKLIGAARYPCFLYHAYTCYCTQYFKRNFNSIPYKKLREGQIAVQVFSFNLLGDKDNFYSVDDLYSREIAISQKLISYTKTSAAH